jgi:hypothetical protein
VGLDSRRTASCPWAAAIAVFAPAGAVLEARRHATVRYCALLADLAWIDRTDSTGSQQRDPGQRGAGQRDQYEHGGPP